MRLGSHSARSARDEWQRIPSNKIAYNLAERNYTGKHVPSKSANAVPTFSPRFRGVGGKIESPWVGGFGSRGAPANWSFNDDSKSAAPKKVSISPAV